MSSPLTLGAVRTALADVIFGDQDEATFLKVCNDALARIYDAGKWDLTGVVEFENPEGFITLPRRYSTILGVQLGNAPRSVYSRYFEYSTAGPGNLDEGEGLNLIVDQGMVPITAVLDTPSTLTMTAPSDTGTTMRVYGLDDDGAELFSSDGSPGIVLEHNVETAETVSEITAVVKEETDGFVTLAAGATTLATYEPTETNPSYHRYKVGTGTDRTFRCLCKRRFVPLINDTDLVHPGNLGALKMGILAASAENASLTEKAQEYWALCFGLLDREKGTQRGNAEIRFNFNPGGAGAKPIRKFF